MRASLYVLLVIAAAARIFLQIVVMPPYAGLDEIQHVAHLAFVAEVHRSPTTRENSIPPYLDDSIHQRPGALPSFAQIGERWPQVVRENPNVWRETLLVRTGAYVEPNYEAQQPQLYYAIVARLIPRQSAAAELTGARLIAALFATLTVIGAALAAEQLFGAIGIAAASLLVMLPTWITLVVRAGNDSLACAFVAFAFAATIRRWHPIVEGLLWAGAFATKLYTWPIAVVLAFVWWRQRAGGRRIVIVIAMSAIAVALTLLDLAHRTSNAFGVVAFDRPGTTSLDAGVNIGEIIRVTIASFAWTSGQHGNALKPIAITLYLLPLLVATSIAWRRTKPPIPVAVVALLAFGAAQTFNVISCVLARRAGNPVPIGGKEGWYWYVLAPIVISTLVPAIATRFTFVWLLLWDIVISEGALFHDYAGETSPAQPSLFFRWGPQLAPSIYGLRVIEVIAIIAMLIIVARAQQRSTTSIATARAR